MSHWTGRRVPLDEALPGHETVPGAVVGPRDDDARVAALDAFLLSLSFVHDPRAALATALADRVRRDRSILRVEGFARAEGLPVRSLQRLFASYVGVGPKRVILRYRVHEALERAHAHPCVDWAVLAAELGYCDQAPLVRDFTATVGVPPTGVRGVSGPAARAWRSGDAAAGAVGASGRRRAFRGARPACRHRTSRPGRRGSTRRSPTATGRGARRFGERGRAPLGGAGSAPLPVIAGAGLRRAQLGHRRTGEGRRAPVAGEGRCGAAACGPGQGRGCAPAASARGVREWPPPSPR